MRSTVVGVLVSLAAFGVFLIGIFYLQKLFLNKVFKAIDSIKRPVAAHDFSEADRG